MISPALIMYSFYRNPTEKKERIDRLQRRLIELGVCEKPLNIYDFADNNRTFKPSANTLDLSLEIRAFNIILQGEQNIDICTLDQLNASQIALRENLIDVYRANIPSSSLRYEKYCEGNLLAVALVLSYLKAIKITKTELDMTLELITDTKNFSIEKIAGIEDDLRKSISAKCQNAGFNFNFLKKFKGWGFWGL